MPAKKESSKDNEIPRRQPADTPEGREQQMVGYAVDLAEKQLREGTASSQVITHYLKMGTGREKLEQEKIANENLRIRAQIAQLESQTKAEELMAEVLKNMKIYAGVEDDDDDLEVV
jgi:hypothetical protein